MKNKMPNLGQRIPTSIFFAAVVLIFTCSHEMNAEDKYVGKLWPTDQRVSFDDIDHNAYDRLLKKYVDSNGMVDYKTWNSTTADRTALRSYLNELGKADPRRPSKRESKLAYWINAYNAVTIEGILQVYPTTSIRNHTAKVWGFNIWKNLFLRSGDQNINLDSIEHKILRPIGEPRIHFAIVCASIGCPRLLNEAYVADRLEEQLTKNSVDFFSRTQNLQVDGPNKTLRLSSIMKWFGEDFGKSSANQIQAVSAYFPDSAKAFVEKGGFRVSFLAYDWDLNAQNK